MGPTLEHCWHVCETTCFQNFIDRCIACQAYWWGMAHSWQSKFGLYGFAEVEASCLCVYIEKTINTYFQPPLIVYMSYMVFQWYMVFTMVFSTTIFSTTIHFILNNRGTPVIPWSPHWCRSVLLQETKCRALLSQTSPPVMLLEQWDMVVFFPIILIYGGGSKPIIINSNGMNIHKSQLFWCELQGYKVLTHCHMFIRLRHFLPPNDNNEQHLATHKY